MTELEAARLELELTKATHLAVVCRLQDEINRLKLEAEKDREYTCWLLNAYDDATKNHYNPGEL